MSNSDSKIECFSSVKEQDEYDGDAVELQPKKKRASLVTQSNGEKISSRLSRKTNKIIMQHHGNKGNLVVEDYFT